MNHINHLAEEIKVLDNKRKSLIEKKSLAAVLIYDTSIKLLESRIAECKAELDKDRHEEIE